ncbi:MAG: NAD(P)-dependent alcohol dehydrogenase [Erythrobacter sp.]
MRAWEIGPRGSGSSGLDGLRMAERDDPVAGPGQVLVRVIAAGLNYRDLMQLRGFYGPENPDDRIPLSDGVGVIEALGEGVSDLAIGDRVVVQNFLPWLDKSSFGFHIFGQDMGISTDGWLAEKIVLPANASIKLPAGVSDETAATLAVAACTVWHAMVAFGAEGATDLSGKLTLAQGTGGMAVFALKLAKAMGAQFAITSSSDDKLAKMRAMGADYTVNYREADDWAAALLEQTGGRGADIVVDTVGFGEFSKTIAATALEGRIGTLGALSGSPADQADFSQGPILGKNITIKGITSGHRGMFVDALKVIAEKNIKMPIDREFAFEDAAAAYAHLESGAHMGKVMIRVSD